MAVTTSAGFISLLDDKIPAIKSFALKRLNELVDEFWPEISEYVSKIEELYEDSSFNDNQLAALLASKVYFHLGAYNDALYFALCADDALEMSKQSEYTHTILSKCIDKYTSLRLEENRPSNKDNVERGWSSPTTYKRMEMLVNRMFEQSLVAKKHKHALGIAIETRRMDIFERAILESDDQEEMMRYAFRVVLTLTDSVHMRDMLLKILVTIYTQRSSPADSVNLCQCLMLLNDPETTAKTLEELISQSEESVLLAYQIAFDLYENSTQHFLQRLITFLRSNIKLGKLFAAIDVKQEEEAFTAEEEALKIKLGHLLAILLGDKVIEMHLQLLIRNNKADIKLLEKIKEDVRNSIMHNATVLANGILHCGTTSDQFLRNHLIWLGKAVNWAKFSATATLGVIHRGHEKDVLKLMSAYLPKDDSGSAGSVYTEGGGLYALGLIHAGHGNKIIEYLLVQCREATSEPVRHGACLGLGLAAMGTGREDVYDQIKMHLFHDDAITGEAAGIGMGLVMLASGSPKAVEDLFGYAKETTHEKIIRGIALGIALVMYGRQEEADELIDTLSKNSDPILRWSGMATIAMAYCGTGSNRAVRILLHTAVSDTNDDVRRWALIAIGFILFKKPDQVPSLLSLLAESYHPHVRYGAAMAVGIACAGTAQKDAIALLDTMIDSTVNYVRQGALIAQAMVLMQQNAVTCPKSIEFREKCLKLIADRHEDSMVKFGAILARAIIDAGGCNMTISLQTRTGNANMAAAVGLLVFQNFWFWYPLANFISLAFTPTALVALNKDLQMPKLSFVSNAKPSTFAFPPPMPQEKEKKREKVATAVLSITARLKKKEKEAKKKEEKEKPIKEEKIPAPTPVVEEPRTCRLENPARVMRAQQRVLSLPDDCRYQALKPVSQGGFVVLMDRRPEQQEEIVEELSGHGPGKSEGTATAGSGAVATTESGEKEACPVNVHASTLGALIRSKSLYKGSGSDEELDDYDEMSHLMHEVDLDDEMDVDDEEEEALEFQAVESGESMDEEEGASVISQETTPGPSDAPKKARKTRSGRDIESLKVAKKVNMTPPEPFEYASDEEEKSGTVTPTPASSEKKKE
ncbi:26S proteasome non-ATPase regulatory subunit 1 [Cichlidogyrus casuarinus]|uniref:26S proteasome non-ATPase regulatory subunit 1 n=1 Tax=Cichlidogyrus casuarinus TaxID=1844966 RepID=A0ABD2QAG9_9PLAT